MTRPSSQDANEFRPASLGRSMLTHGCPEALSALELREVVAFATTVLLRCCNNYENLPSRDLAANAWAIIKRDIVYL